MLVVIITIIYFVRPVFGCLPQFTPPPPPPPHPFCINKTLWRWPPCILWIHIHEEPGVEKQIPLNGGYWPWKILYNSSPPSPPPSPTRSTQGRDTCIPDLWRYKMLVYAGRVSWLLVLLMVSATSTMVAQCAWDWVHSHAPSILFQDPVSTSCIWDLSFMLYRLWWRFLVP